MRDVHSIAAMSPAPDERIELLVVGGGSAGLTAAIEGARLGLNVVLVDENPISPALMGLDVPHMFGQRVTGAVQHIGRMRERIALSEPLIAEAFDVGVDVRLGVTAWGVFPRGPETRAIQDVLCGLADWERSWVAQCDHVIVAAGARDVALGFPGWDQPGVVGAQALRALLRRYDASASRRVLILGSGALALKTALLAYVCGLEVVGLVEPGEAPAGPAQLVAEVHANGLEIFTRTIIQSAEGGADGVNGVTLCSLNGGGVRTIACDTICLAIAQTPNIELLAAAGCALRFDQPYGVWAPELSAHTTSAPRVQAIGECAALGKSAERMAAEAKQAAQAAASGADVATLVERAREPAPMRYAGQTWIEALASAGGLDVLVCRCENVTRAELLGVSPPAYLARDGAVGVRNLQSLLRDGPPHPDQIKRLTRCGMGECQGRRCREQAALLIARAADLQLGRIPLASYRAPVRPLPLSVIAAAREPPEMAQGWNSWFGIPTQFIPYWELDDEISS